MLAIFSCYLYILNIYNIWCLNLLHARKICIFVIQHQLNTNFPTYLSIAIYHQHQQIHQIISTLVITRSWWWLHWKSVVSFPLSNTNCQYSHHHASSYCISSKSPIIRTSIDTYCTDNFLVCPLLNKNFQCVYVYYQSRVQYGIRLLLCYNDRLDLMTQLLVQLFLYRYLSMCRTAAALRAEC